MSYVANEDHGPPRDQGWDAEAYRRASRIPTVTVAVLVAFSVMFGILNAAEGSMKALIIGPLAGGALGLGLGFGWHLVQRRAAQAETDGGRLVIAILCVGLLAAAVLTSARFLAVLIGAGEVMRIERVEALDEAYRSAEAIMANRRLDQPLIVDAETAAATFDQYALDERDSGTLSGRSGQGQTFDALKAATDAYGALATQMRDGFEDREALLERGFERLDTANEANRQGDAETFETALSEARKVLSEAASMTLTSMLGSLTLVESRIADLPGLPDAAGELRRNAGRIADRQEAIVFPSYQPLAPIEAMSKHMERMAFAWLGAVVIELIPALFTFLILTAPRVPSRAAAPVLPRVVRTGDHEVVSFTTINSDRD